LGRNLMKCIFWHFNFRHPWIPRRKLHCH